MPTTVDALKAEFRGEVLLPQDAAYETQRKIWNGMFDRRPAVIARCVGVSDVVQAVSFARENKMLVAVRGGGHSVAGFSTCDGGILIDLSPMRRIHVDPKRKIARIDGGALLGDVDRETQMHGLAVSAGIISHTGVGGLTLGGGFGWISRKHGLTIDNLISAQVVTAAGKVLNVSAKENRDLFWGIRGGGGNFGIATMLEAKCAPIGTAVYAGLIVKRFEDAREYMRFHRDFVREVPDEMTIWLVLRTAPPLPFLPPEVHGKMVAIVPFVWLGPKKKGETMIRPVREAGRSVGENIGMMPWVKWQGAFDPLVAHGARNYWKSHHIKDLSDDCIDVMLQYASKMPTPQCEVFIPHMEGAPSRVPADATAWAHRKVPFVMNIHTRWDSPADDARCLEWARAFHAATQPFAQGVYVNFLSDEGEARVRDAYAKKTWDRLVSLKKRYDPGNLFRMNQNIRPA